MGQKVHPTGFRLGITLDWKSQWFEDNTARYSEKVLEDRKIRKFIKETVGRAGVSSVKIERSLGRLKVVVHVARPGMVIGRGGTRIELLRDGLEKICQGRPEVSVEEVKVPALVANLIAENIVRQVERRRRPQRSMIIEAEKAMFKGAKGIKIEARGRLGGGRYARKAAVAYGSVPLQTIRAEIDYACEEARTKYGLVGIKVWVYLGEKGV